MMNTTYRIDDSKGMHEQTSMTIEQIKINS